MISRHEHTVDGRTPASPWMVEALKIMGYTIY
jgi:hypothetical protein